MSTIILSQKSKMNISEFSQLPDTAQKSILVLLTDKAEQRMTDPERIAFYETLQGYGDIVEVYAFVTNWLGRDAYRIEVAL